MDKVFEQDAFDAGERHLMAVDVAVEDPTPIQTTKPKPAESEKPQESNLWLLPMLTGIAVASVVSCGWLIGNWQISQSQLEQERNLLLVERLRQNITQAKEPMATAGQPRQATLSDLPPPTTEQPLAQQPSAQQPSAQQPSAQQPTAQQPDAISLAPLTLPIRQSPLPSQQPDFAPSITTPEPGRIDDEPQLTGVVQGPGGSSSAIFQVGQGSLSAGIGEPIGNSGWTLDAINDTGAVIRRNGERRNLSVGGVF